MAKVLHSWDVGGGLPRGPHRIVLLPPESLLPTELFIEERVLQVTHQIISEGFWLEPILVERTSRVIMDGHHRREFARRHSLRAVPCVMLDYSQVELYSRQAGVHVSADDIINRGVERRPYPAKTTRHILNCRMDAECKYALADLS
jgi:hypothetical protein